jgi:hypothetical protein
LKLLLDPIYTNEPGHCASTIKMWKIAKHQLELHPDDTFVYWLIADDLTPEQEAWLPDDPRIKYIKRHSYVDRIREYWRMPDSQVEVLKFFGAFWDWDICLTNRTAMVPFYKFWALKGGRNHTLWAKRVVLIEDMPMMDFKKKLTFNFPQTTDLQTIAGYLAADTTYVSAYWEKGKIIEAARDYLKPALLKQLNDTIIETTPVHVDSPGLKTKTAIEPMLTGERPFTIGYVGRMIADSRVPEIIQIMEKQWIFRGGEANKVRMMASTQSQSTGRIDIPDWLELKRLPREGFWDLVKNQMDVYLFMSKEEDYSMSLLEPMLLGTPCILIKDYWSVPTVGEDYPFFVRNQAEAYSLVKAFYDNYPAMYKKFAAWSQGPFKKLMLSRNKDYIVNLFEDERRAYYDGMHMSRKHIQSLSKNSIVQLLCQQDEIDFETDIPRLEKAGDIEHLAMKFRKRFQERVRMSWQTDWNLFRIGLKLFYGFEDASTRTGHLKLIAPKEK